MQVSGIDYSKTIFNPRWFLENMLYIVTKKGKLEKFKLNDEQSEMLEHIEFCLANDLPIRMIVLKARQIGSTTFFTGLGYWATSMNKNYNYGIVAHRLDSAESIFQKCKVFYNNVERPLRPSVIQLSGEGITFDKKDGKGINSKIKFATVNEGVFRGQTMNYLHLTECAFWIGDVQAIENSLAPTVPNEPRTIIVRESTANGYNFFKDDWDRAIKGQNGYRAFFFGWQKHKEYTMDVPRGFEKTADEIELQKQFNLTDGQLVWRRYTIDRDYKGNELWFKQEYPMTPEEAFVASGSGVFDANVIMKGYKACVDPREVPISSVPMFEKLLVWKEPETKTENIYQQKAEWSFEKQAYEYKDTELLLETRTYKVPYTIGVDTAGLGSDYNHAVVVNNITKETVARFGKKNLSEELFAKVLVEMAKKYNDAIIAPEVNYSHEICNFILKEGYKNLYITESVSRQDMKIQGGIEYGWKTTTATKPSLISVLKATVSEDPARVKDREFWYEAEYFLLKKSEKSGVFTMEASSGKHDDIIMATAIAVYVSNSFQAKQTKQVVKAPNTQHFFDKLAGQTVKQTPKLKRGIYTNHA